MRMPTPRARRSIICSSARLTADAAVQIALLNNRGLQAAYNELGIAEAQRIQQSLPPNPSFSISRLTGAAEIEIERQIVGSILALLTLPARADIASERFRRAQLAAALETLRVAADDAESFLSRGRGAAARRPARTGQLRFRHHGRTRQAHGRERRDEQARSIAPATAPRRAFDRAGTGAATRRLPSANG